ncbi:DNA repair and recombination protein RadB [Candidatus Woesearchaeota archaeon]|nr:DNA repair and recombination protein RadB [Candidatus Woesearchaeota archaeon]
MKCSFTMHMRNNLKIPTGSELFNNLLEGGYEKDILTTIYGPSGSGKTTLCMLASIAQASDKKKTIFIDTEEGFSLERMKQLAGDELDSVLKSLILLKPTNFSEQNKALEKLKKIINDKIGLIVVDTLTVFYRLELAKDTNVKETNKRLIWQLSYLTEIARKKSIPILITNQVYSDFSKKDDFRMVGGNILRYNSKCLLKLSNLDKNKRKAILVSHRSIPDGRETVFNIINEGFISTEE